MNIEELRNYCLQKQQAGEYFPFDEHTLAFRVAEKLFALTNLNDTERKVNLKCDPEQAVQLRLKHPGVILPGYHMNKKHWNTVVYDQLPAKMVKKLIDHSYELVVQKLSIKQRKELGLISSEKK